MRKITILLLCGSLAWAGCTAKHYRQTADRDVARIIAGRSPAVRNMDPHFTIEQTNVLSLEGLPIQTNSVDFFGDEAAFEQGARRVSLDEALDLAVKFNREYQLRKEQVYLSALDLTLAQHQFEPIFGGRGTAAYRVDTARLKIVVDEVTGQPTTVPSEDGEPVEIRRVTAQSAFTASWLLRTGTRLTAAATTDFLRYIIGNSPNISQSQLGGALLQPLWGGAAYKATLENLTQFERNTLYALREFTRFRKDFSVQIASAYYGVLRDRDAVQNNWLSYLSFKRSAERTRGFAQEGRIKLSDQGRLEQQELTTENQWANSLRAYKQSLDSFKIQIGLPTSANVVLDEQELVRLSIDHPNVAVEDAIEIALSMRLDYFNARDRYEDAARKVPVAIAALKAQVDLVASTSITSSHPEADRVVALPDPFRYRWDAGFNLDIPLERKAQRNAYRTALIAEKQSERALSLLEDQIKLQVRDGWRSLDQARRNYESAELGVKLAERRVEEQDLLSELGRGVAKDQVDAQVDLTSSKNQRTQALVAHTIARLQFWTALGILFIKENGQWEEVGKPRPDPVEQRSAK